MKAVQSLLRATPRLHPRDMPVMPACCSSCPFLQVDGRDQNRDLADAIRARVMNGSQVCHHPRLSGEKETHLCRGARDHQLTIFYRIGFLREPTDAAWAEAADLLT